ncbi:hypothetical protein EGW08_014885 [Elysia chlorotica]|uniref:CUE domain-containing protein n=1 Tax=Elysia chlorotica TaxID=188477 RepID=A0A3S1B6N7_ELYCH|nr:hypothetical protein EGW08_014885 [Elysia chlorotica]
MMSQTFTSRPSRISRGRGAGRGEPRGASTTSRSSQRDSVAQSIGTSVPINRSRSTPNSHANQGSRLTQPSLFSSRSPNQSRLATRGRGKMDYSQNPNSRPSGGANVGGRQNDEVQQRDVDRSEQSAGGFTVIPRNEQKWQKINQVAQKETAEYERFKQANKARSFNYVGTVGGGEFSQDQVRAKQAHEVRAAKFNRQMKQAEQREAARKAEEEAIEVKRADARRKAELNAQRNARVAPAEEVRRNREAFLAQFESKSPEKATASSPQSSPSPSKGTGQVRGNDYNDNAAKILTTSHSSPGRVFASPAKRQTPKIQQTVSAGRRHFNDSQNRFQQTHVKTEPQVFQNKKSPVRASGSQETESYGVKVEPSEGGDDQYGTSPYVTDEEIQILSSMYPDIDTDYLANLLEQMGSINGAIEALED